MTLGNAGESADPMLSDVFESTSVICVSPLVTVSSRLVTGPLTLMICVLFPERGSLPGVLPGSYSSCSWGLSNLEAVGEAAAEADSLDFRRPTAMAASALLTVITVEDVGTKVGEVGLVEVDDLDEEVMDDLDSLGLIFGEVAEVWVLFALRL